MAARKLHWHSQIVVGAEVRKAQPESRLQQAIVKYLRARNFIAVHVPNGSKLAGTPEQRARAGARLKTEGSVSGFPDLLVYGKGGRIGHIEVKCEGNYQTASQKECERWLGEYGQLVAVCRSIEDIDETLERWGW